MKALPILVALSALHACVEPDDREQPQIGVSVAEMRDETIDVYGCRPGTIEVGEGHDMTCSDPWWYRGPAGPGPTGGERTPGGGVRGGGGPAEGGAGPMIRMDPEPDRKKDFKSCWDWCAWSWRQCRKECRSKHPYPDWDGYNQCMKTRCEDHRDPNIGLKACEADCTERWRDRP